MSSVASFPRSVKPSNFLYTDAAPIASFATIYHSSIGAAEGGEEGTTGRSTMSVEYTFAFAISLIFCQKQFAFSDTHNVLMRGARSEERSDEGEATRKRNRVNKQEALELYIARTQTGERR